jgi:hypothetical protein
VVRKSILALFQHLLHSFALGDFSKEDGQGIGRRIDAVLEPEIPRLIMFLEHDGGLFPHCLFVRRLKRLTHSFRLFRPDMFADEIRRLLPLKYFRSLLVDIDVIPIFIQDD